MSCPHCQRLLPHDAAFCIYCATPIAAASAQSGRPPATQERPATGATIRLNPETVKQPAHHRKHRGPNKGKVQHAPRRSKRHPDPSFPIFVIGMIIIFINGWWWPGILLLMGICHAAKDAARGREHKALGMLVFLAGALILWQANMIWPGIMLVLFISHMISHRRHMAFP